MAEMELSEAAQQWVNLVLIWIGFGALVGLLTKAMLPGREPQGTVGTLLIGVVGSALGPLALTLFWDRPEFNPISPLGFLAAIGGAFVLLIGYRLAITCWIVHREEDDAES